MKKSCLGVIALIVAVFLCACGHTHTWKDATCTDPKTCSDCGETEGEPTGHSWKAATCTEPKTCTICGKTEGDLAEHIWEEATCTTLKTCTVCGKTEGGLSEHTWEEATCTTPKTCTICGKTEGNPAEHIWEAATCTNPKTCTLCGATEGESLGHTWIEACCTTPKTCNTCGATEGEAIGHSCEKWKISKKATCTEKGIETGICTVCGEQITRETELAEHKPGDWEIEKKATIAADGTRVKKCTVCGKVIETDAYKLGAFDTSKIKKRSGYEYDDFTKSWKYYTTYDKRYSDATESITIILFSEDNGTNIEDVEIRTGLYWKDAAATPWSPKSLDFLVDETIYHIDLTVSSNSDSMAYSFLYNDNSYKLIKALAGASKIKVKISYENSHSTELDLTSNPFKTICKDIVDNNMWDYYIPSTFLEYYDTTTIR